MVLFFKGLKLWKRFQPLLPRSLQKVPWSRNGSQRKPQRLSKETATDLKGNRNGSQRKHKGKPKETATDLKGNRNGSQRKHKGKPKETATALKGNQLPLSTSEIKTHKGPWPTKFNERV
jgi:hypothetical protein